MKSANDNYRNFTGTDHYYKHLFGFILTDGAMQLTQDYQCFWFIDIIASYGTHKKIKNEGFQVWKLERTPTTNHFKVKCEDGNNNVLITQDIDYSDFKDDNVEMWCIDKVILLPSEY